MSWVAFIETDRGDRLKLFHPEGSAGGNALLAFLPALDSYCSRTGDTVLQEWFSSLEGNAESLMCETIQELLQCYYSGEMNYEEDAYRWFLEQIPAAFTEEQIQKDIVELMQKWVVAKTLLDGVDKIILLLKKAKLEETWWYDPLWTLADFESLSQTLLLAIQRKAERVRIKFT